MTLLHCGIMLGGYLYYRRFGYATGHGKLFRNGNSFSTENITQAISTPRQSLSSSHSNLSHALPTPLLQLPTCNTGNTGHTDNRGHNMGGFTFGDSHDRRETNHRSDRPPPPGTNSSMNNSNVFYGSGPVRGDSSRDGPNQGSNFRSLYSGVYGSPPWPFNVYLSSVEMNRTRKIVAFVGFFAILMYFLLFVWLITTYLYILYTIVSFYIFNIKCITREFWHRIYERLPCFNL